MACQGRVVNPVLLDEVQCMQGELVLDSLSLALIVVNDKHISQQADIVALLCM